VHAVGIVAAAGSGLRLGADRPKALVPLGGRALVCWAVDALLDGGVRDVVVAVPSAEHSAFATVLPMDVRLVAGGATRTASVRAALAAVGPGVDAVLVHDAARPLTPPDLVARVLDALAAGAPAVVPVLPVVDTTVVIDDGGVVTGTVDRAVLRRVQTPQGFARDVLAAAYARLPDDAELTDDAAVVRAAGVVVRTVAGDERAAKVTVPHDLALAELYVRTTGERASPRAGGTSRSRGTATEERNGPGVEP
jgi:2-C-methyl-D-erythritol 4-phosphate cytidylyltransferase